MNNNNRDPDVNDNEPECDNEHISSTPSITVDPSLLFEQDDKVEKGYQIIRRGIWKHLVFYSVPEILKSVKSVISIGQLVTLILTATAYNTILRTENRTFGWRGALGTFGLQVYLRENIKDKPFYNCKNEHIEAIDTRLSAWHFPSSTQCEYFITGDLKLLLNLLLVGGATISNIICIYYGKCTINHHLKLVKTLALFYPLMALYILWGTIWDLYNDHRSLENDMYYELRKTSLPDAISTWWRNTQILSKCCGAYNGYPGWIMASSSSVNYYTHPYYHTSCYQEIHYPNEDDSVTKPVIEFRLWQEGCVGKEQIKTILLGSYMTGLMLLHGIFGTWLTIEIIRKTAKGNDFAMRMCFDFKSAKLKDKVRINIQGTEIIPVFLTNKAEDVILRLNSVSKIEETSISRMPSICDKFFYSKCVLFVYSVNKKILEVVITGTKDTIVALRAEEDEHCNFVQMSYHQ